jgi:hypothetical protein
MLQISFGFTLPYGFVDEHGTVHREGMMRRATALDEIEPLAHPRVRANEAYLTIALLARVVTRIGTLQQPGTDVIERLFAADFSYLEELYQQMNTVNRSDVIETECPVCATRFTLDLAEE